MDEHIPQNESTQPQVERRQFLRLAYKAPLMYKVCKKATFSKLMEGYSSDVSPSGLRCNLKRRVSADVILWLRLDDGALSMCKEIEDRCAIIQHGILGKVVWAEKLEDKTYDIGVQFVTREEKKADDWFIHDLPEQDKK